MDPGTSVTCQQTLCSSCQRTAQACYLWCLPDKSRRAIHASKPQASANSLRPSDPADLDRYSEIQPILELLTSQPKQLAEDLDHTTQNRVM